MVDNRLDGMTSEFSADGVLLHEIPFKHGQAHGMAKTYYNSGSLMLSTMYQHGVREGMETCLDEKGKVLFTVMYLHGVPTLGQGEKGRTLSADELREWAQSRTAPFGLSLAPWSKSGLLHTAASKF